MASLNRLLLRQADVRLVLCASQVDEALSARPST